MSRMWSVISTVKIYKTIHWIFHSFSTTTKNNSATFKEILILTIEWLTFVSATETDSGDDSDCKDDRLREMKLLYDAIGLILNKVEEIRVWRGFGKIGELQATIGVATIGRGELGVGGIFWVSRRLTGAGTAGRWGFETRWKKTEKRKSRSGVHLGRRVRVAKLRLRMVNYS